MKYQWDYIYVNVLGKGGNVYMRRKPDGDGESRGLRLGTWLGLIYIFGINGLFAALTNLNRPLWTVPAAILGMIGVAIVARHIPDRHFFRAPFRQPYSSRFGGVARLCLYTILLLALANLRYATHGRSALYATLLWLVPLTTSFPFFMLLRDVYQHANTDDGRLTNSRVFFADPFTRWAVFVYGQDMHVPHHLFPAIPHYRLRTLHRLLEERHAEYAALVVECHGTFLASKGRKTILDVLTESADADADKSRPVLPGHSSIFAPIERLSSEKTFRSGTRRDIMATETSSRGMRRGFAPCPWARNRTPLNCSTTSNSSIAKSARLAAGSR